MIRATLCALLFSAALMAADITGKWDFSVETAQGSGNPSFEFKQEGEKLTGSYSGLFGTAKVTGTVKGDAVEFEFTVSQDGQSGKIQYKGTVESPSRMKGTVALASFGEGTWTATKK